MQPWVRAAWAVIPPAAVTALDLLPGRVPSEVAAVIFVVAVVASAMGGGRGAGLGAAVLSFLSLNFVFTQPVGTFSVAKGEDVAALAAFLVVALLVGALVSRVLTQRALAEEREREARLLHRVSGRLLAGEDPEAVVAEISDGLRDRGNVSAMEIEVDERPVVRHGRPGSEPPTRISLSIRERRVGEIRAWPAAGALSDRQRQLVRAVAAQVALAVERTHATTEARKAHEDAERSRLQASLLQSVTHDLRTPLATITASVTGLLDEEAVYSQDARRDLLQAIRDEAERLDRLVGDLLDVSRLRAGATVGERHAVAVEELIEGVLGRLHPALASHRVKLVIRDDLPDARVDVIQVQQALANVLENAAKFSPPGTEISVSAARWEDTVRIRIADQGRPIPEHLRPSIFEPFVRGDDEPGTGLGLAIAHAVVVGHGGSIWVEDSPGGGTAVVLQLPVEAP